MADFSFNKQEVANSFSKAARTYDQAAGLQRVIAERLLETVQQVQQPLDDSVVGLLDSKKLKSNTLLDLGCGTGLSAQQLINQFPGWRYMGLDIAQGMVRFAKQRHSLQNSYWFCGDAERLPFSENSFQFIYSGFALQWCLDFTQALQEIHRTLQIHGLFAFSVPLLGTLNEIQQAWKNVDTFVHVNEFHGHDNIEKWLMEQGFTVLHASQNTMIEYFDSFRDVACSLKCIGAHNMNKARSNTLMGRDKLRRLVEGYEVFRGDNEKLPLTYQVGLYVAQKR